MNSTPVKTKIGTYGDNVYTNIRGVNVLEDGFACESFAITSIDPLLGFLKNSYYLQVYLDECAYKSEDK